MQDPRGFMEHGRVLLLPIVQIRPNPSQPRKIFEPESLRELSQSIKQYGILQPLTVRRSMGAYELVAGERRLRAARLAGLSEVPCILLTVDEEQAGMLAMIENLQRMDLDYIEEAQGLAKLMSRFGLSQEQAAAKIGKSQSAVANKLRLLRHSPPVLCKLREHGLSERHARALLRLPGEEERLKTIEVILQRQLTVAKTEAYIEALLEKQETQTVKCGMRKFILRDLRLFLNSVNHSLDLVRGAGIDARSQQEETEHEIVLTIRLPKGRVGG